MTKVKLYSRFAPLILIVAMFCSACDVPDISEFTKQSAEMTRGIRKGSKDTEGLIKTASARADLYSAATRAKLKTDLKDYQNGIKPTVASLDALDAYLEALNALAQANKKSEENSSAVVASVTNLVTAISGLTFASSAVNVATGLLTLAEEFRTSRDFKKRVNLAAEIVEGRYVEKRNAAGQIVLDAKGKPVMVKACTGQAEESVTRSGKEIKELFADILTRAHLTEIQLNTLKPMTPGEKRNQLRAWGKMTGAEHQTIRTAESEIASWGCGVIDFIKFNINDLKEINLALSESMFTNASRNNKTVLGFYKSIEASDKRVQRELEAILNYEGLVSLIRELEATDGSPEAIEEMKLRLKTQLDALFIMDGDLRNSVTRAIAGCGQSCGRMRWFVDYVMCDECKPHMVAILNNISKAQFDRGNGFIEEVLAKRAVVLDDRNVKFLDDLKRITPSHSAVVSELDAIQDKQNDLDALLDSSMSALDTWAETHANLRVALNTRKPLTVAKLTSKVREIWSIIEPEKK